MKNQIVRSIFAYDDYIVWAAARGKILYTTSGGITNVKNINSNIAESYRLYQNYPNPFNPVTIIKFDVVEKSNVKISITDVSGKIYLQLLDEELNKGTYQTEFRTSVLPSGIYFYYMEVNNKIKQSKKMILTK